MPKCVVVDPDFDWTGEAGRQNVPWEQTIFYEAHVKGFIKRYPGIPERVRGTYSGFGCPPIVHILLRPCGYALARLNQTFKLVFTESGLDWVNSSGAA
jgi:pullulanase/glycogen debranching enzyme